MRVPKRHPSLTGPSVPPFEVGEILVESSRAVECIKPAGRQGQSERDRDKQLRLAISHGQTSSHRSDVFSSSGSGRALVAGPLERTEIPDRPSCFTANANVYPTRGRILPTIHQPILLTHRIDSVEQASDMPKKGFTDRDY